MDLNTLFVILIFVITVLMVIYVFIKTPKAEQTQEHAINDRAAYLEKKLASYPEGAQAVIIKGNKKKAFAQILPYFLLMAPFIAFTIYITYAVEDLLCDFIFGINTALIAMLILLCALPIMILMASFTFVRSALKTIKTGYSPPLDSIQFLDTISAKTTYAKFYSYFIVFFLPLYFVFVFYYLYSTVMSMTDNKPLQFFKEKNEMICKKSYNSQRLKSE